MACLLWARKKKISAIDKLKGFIDKLALLIERVVTRRCYGLFLAFLRVKNDVFKALRGTGRDFKRLKLLSG